MVEAPPPPAPLPTHATLTGILLADDKATALVSSSKADWTGAFDACAGTVLGPGTVIEVDSRSVRLCIGDFEFDWRVGTKLIEAQNAWRVEDVSPGSARSPAAHGSGSVDSGARSGPLDREEIIRRLRERREKELAR